MRVAREAFWTRSCMAVSVDTLCREAGVNKGSFYHFFESKQAIILEVLDSDWREIREQVIEPAFDPGLPPFERIRQLFIRQHALQAAKFETTGLVPGCPFLNLGSELGTLDPALRERVADIVRRQLAYLESTLREAAESGEFAGNPKATAHGLLASLAGLILHAKIANRPSVILEGIDSAMACLRNPTTALLG